MTTALWEILVPTVRNCGKPFKTRHHREWDSRVRRISNGLTILTPAKGQWVSPSGALFQERMIPVRISCTREQIEQIIQIAIKHYDQEAIMAYRLSDEVILRYAEVR